jgi:hypothetical protein
MINFFLFSAKKLIGIGGLILITAVLLSCNTLKIHGFGKHSEMMPLYPENVIINSNTGNELQKENFTALFNSMERQKFGGSTEAGSKAVLMVRISELGFIKDSTEVFPETLNSIIIEIEVFEGGTKSAGYTLVDTTTESLASPRYMEKVIKAIMGRLHG